MFEKNYFEVSIAPSNIEKQRVLYLTFKTIKIVNVIFFAVAFFIAFFFSNFFWFITIMELGIILLSRFLQRKFYCFYDYTFINGSVRTNRVINNKKSVPFANFECSKIISAGNLNSGFFTKNKYNKEFKVYVAKTDVGNLMNLIESEVHSMFYIGEWFVPVYTYEEFI